jgi:hypothetical protein
MTIQGKCSHNRCRYRHENITNDDIVRCTKDMQAQQKAREQQRNRAASRPRKRSFPSSSSSSCSSSSWSDRGNKRHCANQRPTYNNPLPLTGQHLHYRADDHDTRYHANSIYSQIPSGQFGRFQTTRGHITPEQQAEQATAASRLSSYKMFLLEGISTDCSKRGALPQCRKCSCILGQNPPQTMSGFNIMNAFRHAVICSRCLSVWYCSVTCARRDWFVHRYVCRLHDGYLQPDHNDGRRPPPNDDEDHFTSI